MDLGQGVALFILGLLLLGAAAFVFSVITAYVMAVLGVIGGTMELISREGWGKYWDRKDYGVYILMWFIFLIPFIILLLSFV